MKKLFVIVILALLVGCVSAVPQEDYDAAIGQISQLRSELSNSQAELGQASVRLSKLNTAISVDRVLLRKLATLLASKERQLTDAKRESLQLTRENQQLTGLMFCGGINQDWSVRSVDEALTLLDSTNQWDFRSGLFRSWRVWNNSGVQYIVARATSDGEEYGFPYIIYPAEERGGNMGIFNLTDQCWVFMDIPGILVGDVDI